MYVVINAILGTTTKCLLTKTCHISYGYAMNMAIDWDYDIGYC